MKAVPVPKRTHARTHRRYLELSDILCPNETELALLCKGDIDPKDDESVIAGARELLARGTELV